jgi:hypothetical protein
MTIHVLQWLKYLAYISNRILIQFMEYNYLFCGEQNGLIKLDCVLICYEVAAILDFIITLILLTL